VLKETHLKQPISNAEELITITLPDGTIKQVPKGTKISSLLSEFGKNIPETALAAKVNGQPVDLSFPLQEDSKLEILTPSSEDSLDIYRHTASHILAHAVKSLFPEVKVGIGPATEEGFYYDFDKPEPFTPEDLDRIEERMKEIIEKDYPIVRKTAPKEELMEFFRSQKEDLKIELIQEKGGESCSYYEQERFADFCLGPHLPSTGKIKAFKVLSVAGAYWKGDEHNQMLQRIYATAFLTQKELKKHLVFLEEAKKRDHRKLGKDLDLFSVHEEAGAGFIYWHPNGAIIRRIVEDFWKEEHIKHGYQLIFTPHVVKDQIWRQSGHYEYYRENMYTFEHGKDEYVVKPMNCNGHILIYKNRKRSYRELPIRYAELGTVYRYERSGVLHGMMRVRGFTQDDAHIFCTKEQLSSEIEKVIDLARLMLDSFGYNHYEIDLSTSDANTPEKYTGERQDWEHAERILAQVLDLMKLEYKTMEGEAAFYGPKIDIKMLDALGRAWQGPTIQFDFNLPERLGVYFTAADSKEYPVLMIHRTVLGSMERFVGGLIEHYAGAFPLWLAPVQMKILPITERNNPYAEKIRDVLSEQGFRAQVDHRNEKIGLKIREAQLEKIPYMLVLGDREEKQSNISLRVRGAGDKGTYDLQQFIAEAQKLVKEKALKL
jgi:threonyl-tRNA synthetase